MLALQNPQPLNDLTGEAWESEDDVYWYGGYLPHLSSIQCHDEGAIPYYNTHL